MVMTCLSVCVYKFVCLHVCVCVCVGVCVCVSVYVCVCVSLSFSVSLSLYDIGQHYIVTQKKSRYGQEPLEL